jgi:hypothetical protein
MLYLQARVQYEDCKQLVTERFGCCGRQYRLTDPGVAKAPDSVGLARRGRPPLSLREESLPGPKIVSVVMVQGQ